MTTEGFEVTTIVSGLVVVPVTPFVVFGTVVVNSPGPVVTPVINVSSDIRCHFYLHTEHVYCMCCKE